MEEKINIKMYKCKAEKCKLWEVSLTSKSFELNETMYEEIEGTM